MGERKVTNKYFPPDFDPSKLGRKSGKNKDKKKRDDVRAMLPFSCQCNACNMFLYRGKKFNSRKEFTGETYLGIKILRLFFKCPGCGQQMTFLTDPENADYKMERGGRRLFEAKGQSSHQIIDDGTGGDGSGSKDDSAKSKVDALAELEKRAQKSKEDMEELDMLEEIKARNLRNKRIDVASFLKEKYESPADGTEAAKALAEEEAHDSLVAKQAFLSAKRKMADAESVSRLEKGSQQSFAASFSSKGGPSVSAGRSSHSALRGLVKRRKIIVKDSATEKSPVPPKVLTTSTAAPLDFLSMYGDDSDSD